MSKLGKELATLTCCWVLGFAALLSPVGIAAMSGDPPPVQQM